MNDMIGLPMQSMCGYYHDSNYRTKFLETKPRTRIESNRLIDGEGSWHLMRFTVVLFLSRLGSESFVFLL